MLKEVQVSSLHVQKNREAYGIRLNDLLLVGINHKIRFRVERILDSRYNKHKDKTCKQVQIS